MSKALNILRWFLLGMITSVVADNTPGAVILLLFVVLNFEERAWGYSDD